MVINTVTGPERGPQEVLSVHIDPTQLPTEYGGHSSSIHAITHPFQDAITCRRGGCSGTGGMRRHASHSLSSPAPQKDRKASLSSATLGAIYDTDDEYNNLSVSMGTSLVDALDDVSGRALSTTSSSRTHPLRSKRSASVASSFHTAGSKTDYVLSGVAMTPAARAALGAFVDLLLGGSPALSLLSVDMGSGMLGDGQTTISSMSPISNRSLDTFSLSQGTLRPSLKPSPSTTIPLPLTIHLPLKPSVFCILLDGALQTSVGSSAVSSCDVLAVRTASGVVLLKTAPVGAVMQPSAASYRSYTPKRITCKKYSGNLVLSGGRVYSLTRGASMCGWLQKWPMR